MPKIRTWTLIGCLIVLAVSAQHATAGPPSYLLLRRADATVKPAASHAMPPASGYAYGYFGVCPRQHASWQHGYHRIYTQLRVW